MLATIPATLAFLVQNTARELVGIKPYQAIGGIIPYAVISAEHIDKLAITQFPIETGASITDHAYKRPASLTMRVLWTPGFQERLVTSSPLFGLQPNITGASVPIFEDTSSLAPLAQTGLLGEGRLYLNAIYDYLLGLQVSREPFDVFTTRRSYHNMLIQTLSVNTVLETQNILIADIQMQQIKLAYVQQGSGGSLLPQTSNQAAPEITASPISTGTQNLVQASL